MQASQESRRGGESAVRRSETSTLAIRRVVGEQRFVLDWLRSLHSTRPKSANFAANSARLPSTRPNCMQPAITPAFHAHYHPRTPNPAAALLTPHVSAATACMSALSVVLHLDLDSFYAQVERERLRLPSDAAVVVVQWRMALAVSYPARKYGIKRGANVDDIRRLAGDKVTVVHVETIGGESRPDAPGAAHGTEVVNTQKISLARYRTASNKVFASMTAAIANYHAKFQRASIDEAYIDVTREVDRRMSASPDGTRAWPKETVVVGDRLDLGSQVDARLAYGADIAAEVRAHVLKDCGFTVSAGVCVNKLLSKFASAQNKPNNQTIVPVSAITALMKDVPLRKLRGLGGKLGKEVEALGVATAGEAAALSMETLEKALGGRKMATFVYNSVRGKDDSEVTERDKTKTLLAAKSFASQHSLAPVEKHWLPILAEELAERLLEDLELYNRDAKNLVISFRLKAADGVSGMISASRSTPMPAAAVEARASAILSCAVKVLRRAVQEQQFTFPITFIGLTATNFVDRAHLNESIERYLQASGQEANNMHATSGLGKKLVLDGKEAHKRRLQEKADRDLALRLHREESLRGIAKERRKTLGQKSSGAGSAKKARNGKKSPASTMDKFLVRNKDKQPKR